MESAQRVVENSTELTVTRCEVCSVGAVQQGEPGDAPRNAQPASSPADDLPWRIDIHGAFARELFDQKHHPPQRPHPSDSTA
jgi:hypothetical protein